MKSQSEGIIKASQPVELDSEEKIDLIVLGSVAVSKTGRCNYSLIGCPL